MNRHAAMEFPHDLLYEADVRGSSRLFACHSFGRLSERNDPTVKRSLDRGRGSINTCRVGGVGGLVRSVKVSKRQAEVVSLVARGYLDKEIARQLGISLGTVKTYLSRLYRDNGFRNRAEAVAACLDEAKSVGRRTRTTTPAAPRHRSRKSMA